ncbi:OmpA family protein [Thiomicrorhabdus cannonii]|uniref:OmpA family protein n=1 Tax=Thiomicrorhabdus cannonii TaxID=2748011 RepID=UPI0015BE2C7D|nr:OmpA family protein [Thiomicrorhabdus cannonii]
MNIIRNPATTGLIMLLTGSLGVGGCSATEENAEKEQPYAIQQLYKDDIAKLKDYYNDLDQDGVVDSQDHCQNSKLGSSVDAFGCGLDSDGDGVYNQDDLCPGTPKGAIVNAFGCEPDSDGDGVPDSRDECPNTPKGVEVDERGCPLDRDTDRDGVFNEQDKCPDTPRGVKVNKYGCPPEILVLSNIEFDVDSSVIRDDQATILDQNASRLKELKSTETLLITGHTDSSGTDAHNLKLSWQRADSAKEFLLKALNFKDEQIRILGKGESAPIADNATKEGRQTNRRIELKIVPTEQLPEDSAVRLPESFMEIRR